MGTEPIIRKLEKRWRYAAAAVFVIIVGTLGFILYGAPSCWPSEHCDSFRRPLILPSVWTAWQYSIKPFSSLPR